MPRIEFEASKGVSLLNALGQELEKPTRDSIAAEIADIVVQRYKDSFLSTANSITGTGLNSIESRHLSDGVYGIYMADYLEHVDKGTNSGYFPRISNRLKAAANEYGMDPRFLAIVIFRKGTKPHPFKRPALQPLQQIAEDIAEQEMAEALERAMDDMSGGRQTRM